MKNLDKKTLDSASQTLSIKEILLKYQAHWPLFVASLAVALAGAYFYLRYTPQTFVSTATLYVKEPEQRSGPEDIMQGFFGTSRINLENEINLIKSPLVARRAALATNSNVRYSVMESLRPAEFYETDLPVHIKFLAVADSNTAKSFQLKAFDPQNGYQLIHEGKTYSIKTGDTTMIGGNLLVLKKTYPTAAQLSFPVLIRWTPIAAEANAIRGSLSVVKIERQATILRLNISGLSPSRNEAILHGVIEEYKKQNIDDKNLIAQNTIAFIDDRLALVSGDLRDVETGLRTYKRSQSIVDPATQAEAMITGDEATKSDLRNVEVKLQLAGMFRDYISKPNNSDELIPSSLGLEDPILEKMVEDYNTLQLKREKELRNGIPQKSPLISDLNNQLGLLRTSISENVNSSMRMLSTQRNDIAGRQRSFKAQISAVPEQELQMQEILRQKGVKEALYLYLLEKREESAISTAGTISNYKVVDPPSSSPSGPSHNRIYLIGLLIGLGIPLLIIAIRELLNDKITSRSEITRVVNLPIAGDIGHHTGKADEMLVKPDSRKVIAEQFRIIRTNIQYLTQGKSKFSILITSTISGEGKSYASANIASVFAIGGKKTALLEFDLRKPKIVKNLGLNKSVSDKGITTMLLGRDKPEEIVVSLSDPDYANLHIYPAGPIPPNPSELMLNPRLNEFVEYLNANYDVIIFDSAPVGLVGDSFTLGQYCDISLYVIRQRYSHRRQLQFIEELNVEKKLPSMGLLVNDVVATGAYGYYGQGYGYGYGYGYGKGKNEEGNSYFDEEDEKGYFQQFMANLKKLGKKKRS